MKKQRTHFLKIDRFPPDFMFVLNHQEIEQLLSQFVIPSKSHLGGAMPFAFTEQGVAMISSVLKSHMAIKNEYSNNQDFCFVRKYALTHLELSEKLNELALKCDQQFNDIFDASNYLIKKDKKIIIQENKERIGFR